MQTDYRDILLAIAAAALILCAVVIATMEPPAAEAPALATVRHVALNALRIGGDLITFEAERPGAELTALDRAAIRALYRYKRATSAPLD